MFEASFYKNPIFSRLDLSDNFITELGDCPNLEFKTAGGKFFWDTVNQKNGLRLQVHRLTGQARILDSNDIRKSWGSQVAMREKLKRLARDCFLEKGDVIGISRKSAFHIYEHYAVYIGNNQVVHYAGDNADFTKDIRVRKAYLSDFLKDDKDYFVLYFQDGRNRPIKIHSRTQFKLGDKCFDVAVKLKPNKKYYLYSPCETVKRALSKLGESEYNLFMNNCEHFAIWCKTGISECYQLKLNTLKLEFSDYNISN